MTVYTQFANRIMKHCILYFITPKNKKLWEGELSGKLSAAQVRSTCKGRLKMALIFYNSK
jgi:hypothetical protein